MRFGRQRHLQWRRADASAHPDPRAREGRLPRGRASSSKNLSTRPPRTTRAPSQTPRARACCLRCVPAVGLVPRQADGAALSIERRGGEDGGNDDGRDCRRPEEGGRGADVHSGQGGLAFRAARCTRARTHRLLRFDFDDHDTSTTTDELTDDRAQKGERRIKDLEVCLPICVGTVSFWLGKKVRGISAAIAPSATQGSESLRSPSNPSHTPRNTPSRSHSLAISDAPSPPGISRSARRATFRPMSTTPIDGRCTFEGQRTKIYLRS